MSLGSVSYNKARLRRATNSASILTVAGGGGTDIRGTGDQYSFVPMTDGRFRTTAGPDGTIYVLDSQGIHRVSRIIR